MIGSLDAEAASLWPLTAQYSLLSSDTAVLQGLCLQRCCRGEDGIVWNVATRDERDFLAFKVQDSAGLPPHREVTSGACGACIKELAECVDILAGRPNRHHNCAQKAKLNAPSPDTAADAEHVHKGATVSKSWAMTSPKATGMMLVSVNKHVCSQPLWAGVLGKEMPRKPGEGLAALLLRLHCTLYYFRY